MDARRQHHGMHAPLQSQQFPPLLQQGGGHPSRLPLPLPHPHMGFSPRPSSFLGGGGYPLAGQKRSGRSSDDGGFTKLFVASLPRNISEDEVRDLFGGFGNVLEVIFLKDKKTGLPQGCCFIKYANAMDAERAIRALDNQRTLQGGPAPLQVKFADSERDHPGPLEHKLFVGSLNKQAGEQEIEEIFAPYGRVENVYVIRDDQKQSRGCAFVTFPEKDMAIAAISALNGIYRMAGCHQPIIVRFADPKRPRSGERESHRMGGSGPNYSPRSHHGGSGPHQGVGGQRSSGGTAMEAHSPAFGWRQGGGAGGMGLLPQAGILPLGAPTSTPAPARKGPLEGSNSAMGFKESPLHKPGQMFGQPLPLQQQPIQQSLPNTSHQNQVQPLQGFSLPQSTDTRSQQHVSVGQYTLPQPAVQMYSQTSLSNNPLQQGVLTSMQQPIPTLSSQPLQFHSLRQQDSQLNQQVQTAQPSQQVHQILPLQPLQPQVGGKETSQQAYLQPLQMMSQSSQQPTTLQPSWSIPVQQQAVPSQQQVAPSQQQVVPSQQQAVPLVAMPVTTTVSVAPTPTVASCEWTEHTSPEGHKYYYNSSTGESRWEKPEEFAVFEQQQQQQHQQQQQQQQQQLSHPQQLQQHHHQQQQQQPQLLQQPQQINPQLVQAQVQAHVQQLQPQQMNPHYQQQLQPQQQVQQAPSQSYQQQPQPQLQQLHQQAQVQQPQLQQLPHLQQLQPQAQLQQLQQSQPQLQQPQREAQFTSSGLQFSQLPSGGAYQASQGYAHVQAASQPANGIGDASRGPQLQQFTPNQQIPAANGILDPARGAQWMPAMQQGLPNQDWMWKSKPAGS